jgi:hypothetical protein
MKRLGTFLACAVGLALVVAGCAGAPTSGGKTGRITFTVNLNDLQSSGATVSALATLPTITAVTLTVSREGHESIVSDLVVANNVATGTVGGLAPGYWQVEAVVKENATVIYTGSADVEVVAGATKQCTMLFDPVEPPAPTTGDISINVGLNPLPGYRVVNQMVNSLLLDEASAELFILDTSTNLIGVYDANTLARKRDIPLPQAPQSIALTPDRSGILMGYPAGNIYRLDIATGIMTSVGDVMMPVLALVPFGANYVLAVGSGSAKSVNLVSGQVVDTQSLWYSSDLMQLNPANSTVYYERTGVSPSDIHRIRVDASTGDIVSTGESPYHGDYYLGSPLRVIKNGSRIVTAWGSMFTCSALDADDLRYAGNLGYRYIDLLPDEQKGYLYVIGNDTVKKLLVIGQSDLFLKTSIELKGNPKRIFHTATSILVITEYQGRYYMKAWTKANLGIN